MAGRDDPIFLIGFMGAGKSVVGAVLAKRLRWAFVDLDRLVMEREKRSISEIFARDGEQGFRLAELRALDVGSWFGAEFAGERALTLDELFDEYAPRIPLVLQIKDPRATRPLVEGVRAVTVAPARSARPGFVPRPGSPAAARAAAIRWPPLAPRCPAGIRVA